MTKITMIVSRTLVNSATVGMTKNELGRSDRAISSGLNKLVLATSVNESDERAWWNLGLFYDQQGLTESAVEAWQHIPESGERLVELGKILLKKQNDGQNALHWLIYAERMLPEEPQVWKLLGDAYISINDFNNSGVAYQKALSLEPSNAEHYIDYANLLLVGDYEATQAKKLLDRALSLDPNNENVYRTLASLASKEHNEEQVLFWLEKAASVPDSSVDTLLHLVSGYEEMGEYTQAVEAAKLAVERSSKSPWTHLSLAKAYIYLNKYLDQAVIEAQLAMQLAPDSIDARLTLLKIYAQLGDEKNGQILCGDIIDKNLTNQEIFEICARFKNPGD